MAITKMERLPDEAIGLPAGSLQASVSAVIGSLWPANLLQHEPCAGRNSGFVIKSQPPGLLGTLYPVGPVVLTKAP
jgi:hypothetical protein